MTVWALGLAGTASAVLFTPHYTDSAGEGFYDPMKGAQRRAAFEFALAIWQTRIPGAMNANVDIDASFDPMGGTQHSATLGTGGPAEFDARFSGAPASDVAYPSPVANYLAGTDLNGSAADIEIQFNSDVDGSVLGNTSWYYGLDGQPGSTGLDFVSVCLHELTHGLGLSVQPLPTALSALTPRTHDAGFVRCIPCFAQWREIDHHVSPAVQRHASRVLVRGTGGQAVSAGVQQRRQSADLRAVLLRRWFEPEPPR